MSSDVTARVRPARFDDVQSISRIHEQHGLDHIEPVAWRARWESYPFAAEFQDIPIGWVLEAADGQVVGSLGSLHMLYDLAGQNIKALIAASWVVEAPYRAKALQLMTAFYRQKGVDLWLNGSANVVTAQVLTALRIPRIPIPDYATPCFWALRPRAFAKAALVRRSFPVAALSAYPAGLALHVRDVFRRSGRGKISSAVRRLPEFDDRFDLLWKKISAGPPRLRAVRTRAALEWRFGAEIRGKRAVLLASDHGYVVLLRRQGSELGMEMYDVADLQAAGDDPAVVRDLLLASIAFARGEGVDALKFMTGTPAKRAPANALQPYTYQLPLWQLYYKTASKELGGKLGSADAWDYSLFDTY